MVLPRARPRIASSDEEVVTTLRGTMPVQWPFSVQLTCVCFFGFMQVNSPRAPASQLKQSAPAFAQRSAIAARDHVPLILIVRAWTLVEMVRAINMMLAAMVRKGRNGIRSLSQIRREKLDQESLDNAGCIGMVPGNNIAKNSKHAAPSDHQSVSPPRAGSSQDRIASSSLSHRRV
jgi:hypothetical protein